MSTFILVSGSWHGAWCWDRLVPLLEERGHRAIAAELAGMGKDSTPLAAVSLAGWADQIAALVRSQGEPVILVGHSRGGIVISEAAERAPDRIAGLVYLAAALLPSGRSTADITAMKAEVQPGHAIADLYVSAGEGAARLKPQLVRSMFFNTTPPHLADWAEAQLGPEPLAPLRTALQLTDANFGSIRRDYIECLRDNAIPIDLQRRFREDLPCATVTTLDTDHSPFLSAPDALAAVLDGIATDIAGGAGR